MKKRRFLSVVLSVAMLVCMLSTPVCAADYGEVEVSIPAQQFSSSYHANDKEWSRPTFTFYLEPDEFPVNVTIKGERGAAKEYVFDAYGSKSLEVKDYWSVSDVLQAVCMTSIIVGPFMVADSIPHVYARIVLAPPEEQSEPIIEENEIPVVEETQLEFDTAAYEAIMERIEFPSQFQGVDVYTKDIKEYLAGVWDGERRTDYENNFIVNRSITSYSRTYSWYAGRITPDEEYNIKLNLDYEGDLEICVGRSSTFAFDRETGVVEQWRYFERLDSWQIDSANGRIEKIYYCDGREDIDAQAIVKVLDANGEKHFYRLFPGGIVRKDT